MNYWKFISTNARFLAFGLSASAFTGFGQTFFIALFSADLRAAFALTHGQFGMLYSGATFLSGILLIPAGRQLDRIDLRRFTVMVLAGLAVACALMASALSAVWLGAALFALRFGGQGLIGLVAGVSMARYFSSGRGKALSIAGLGHPLSEALLPALAVFLLAAVGWREAWALMGAAIVILGIPWMLWLLKGHSERHKVFIARTGGSGADAAPASRQWTAAEVIRDPRFLMVLPATLAMPFVVTGLFFHHVHLAEVKGWSMPWLASAFVGFAVAHIATGLLAGPLIDKISARRMARFFLLPMAGGLVLLISFDHALIAFAYLIAFGISMGFSSSTGSALWAELYGAVHIGAIRSLHQAIMVLSTSLSPVAVGLLIDRSVSMETIAGGFLIYVGIAILMAIYALQVKR